MQIVKEKTYIRIDKLFKKYGSSGILNDIELNIEQGEFVAVVGRSGCGKSTLLRLIAGLEKPSSGTIYVNEEEVSGINKDTRVLFQEARLLPWKPVLKNVEVGVGNKHKEVAKQALESVGLGDRGNEWPYVLSGGQKQRVALARAISAKPKLLLLDEPLGALDALTRIEMQQLIEKLWFEQGFTAILVTHDVSEAVALADRVILIDEGKIAMNTKITLARPRQRNNDFIYFEKLILDRVMNKTESSKIPCQSDKLEYHI